MKSLVLSEIDFKDFQKNEDLYVTEQYYHDFLKRKKIKNNINILSPSFSNKSERISAMSKCETIYSGILKDLSNTLNNLHKVNLSDRVREI